MSLRDYISKIKYLVIDKEKNAFVYQSLREISSKIQVDSSTISNKLKPNGNGGYL